MVAQHPAGDGSVILQTPSTREEVLCFAVHRNSAGLTQRMSLTWVQPSKLTSRPRPVLLSTSPTHHCSRFAAEEVPLIFGCAMCCGWLICTSSRRSLPSLPDHTRLYGLGLRLIEPSTAAFRHTTDSSSASILHTFFYLATSHWTKPFTTVSTLVEAGVGTLWSACAHDGNGKSTHSLTSQYAGTLATRS